MEKISYVSERCCKQKIDRIPSCRMGEREKEKERGEVERENRHVSRKYHFEILDGQNVKFGESNQIVTF